MTQPESKQPFIAATSSPADPLFRAYLVWPALDVEDLLPLMHDLPLATSDEERFLVYNDARYDCTIFELWFRPGVELDAPAIGVNKQIKQHIDAVTGLDHEWFHRELPSTFPP